MPILSFAGKTPRLASGVFVAPSASLIGDVEIGEGASVWFGCVIRADGDLIRIGRRSNIQDLSVLHIGNFGFRTSVGDGVTIGHRAVLHGCTIEDDCMVGIGAVVLDGAVVESGAIVAAGAVVSPGKRVARGELWAGVPAKKMREVRHEELGFIRENAASYAKQAALYLRG
jgi:carbonic anhydrase/acetyltransferase-like protein (isoleucine patch superfamily)